MLICDCGWQGTDLIPHPDGAATARCPRCLTVFMGIRSSDAIYDLDMDNWKDRTRPNMNKIKGSWVGAWKHYRQYKTHYDTSRAKDRTIPCKMTGETRLHSDGITVTQRCLLGTCKTCLSPQIGVYGYK